MGKRQEAEWILQQRRNEALEGARQRLDAIRSGDEQYRTIELALQEKRQALLWASLRQEPLAPIHEEIQTLEEQLNARLEGLGIEQGQLKPQFTCPICEDTGRVEQKDCSCLRHLLMNLQFSSKRAQDQMKNDTFNNMNMDLFRKTRKSGEDVSPRALMQDVYADMKEFCDTYPKDLGRNFLFYGPVGTGKTYLCHAMAQALMEKGVPIVYRTAYEMLSIFQDAQFAERDIKEEKSKEREYLFEADVLFIDDLGTESIHSLSVSYFFQLINDRILAGKTTVISTNLEPMEIQKIYSPRIFSRLFGEFTMYNIYGDDLRLKL